MNCPKCGYPIYQGDIACRNCKLPVMAMNSIPQDKVAPKQQVKEEVAQIKTPYIEPTRIEPSYIPKDSIQIIPKEETQKEKKQQFTNYGEGKKAITSIKFLIPIFLGIIALGILAYGIMAFISTLVEDKKATYIPDETIPYQLEFNEFLYSIPNEYTYQKEASTATLHISDEKNSWTASIQVMDATYSSIRSRKASLKSYFQSIGYMVGDVTEEKYGSASYLLLQASKNKKNYILAVTKAGDSSKSFGVAIKTKNNEQDYTILETISSILTGAKYQNKTSTNEQNIDFNFSDILK